MPRDESIKKVLVIGSGPIIIGQAAEFDYAGTQACRVLKSEGIEVVLVNSNPATIMTDTDIADRVYLEPLTLDSVSEIIKKERPDALLPTLGGQTGLNLAVELSESGVLEKYGVRLLGTSVSSIHRSEDREAFKDMLSSIGEPVIASVIANDVKTAMAFAEEEGYPLIVRPAYTLGGTGGGIADNEEQLERIVSDGLRASRVHQVLVEKSVSGWKEIEYEVMRDGSGNCITVCSMENLDPVGIHTGDSIVVAPTQTLRDAEHQMLRGASINIISELGIEGGCNCQFALDPESMTYYVIEVNPRVSRSSALASKATGYPIAKVATYIAIGYNLDEIENGVTGKTCACFEPALDYIVVKIPRWPFDKFTQADKQIGTRMKATGEVMAIGTNFEAALLKAVRSLEMGQFSLDAGYGFLSDYEVEERLHMVNSERLFAVAEALRRGTPWQLVCEITGIDPWFIVKIQGIVQLERRIAAMPFAEWTQQEMALIKSRGFSDKAIAAWQGVPEGEVRRIRLSFGITPSYRMVDTCGGEFEAESAYYYSAYGVESEHAPAGKKTVVVLGSGPIRIGQGVEFDYCSVHCVWALKKAGYETVIINNNPETVSTDFDTSDRLYFEPLTAEDVISVLDIEKPVGVVCQFGGQTAIKLARAVADAGYDILGTGLDDIDAAEDRELFDALLESLAIRRPKGLTVFTADEAVKAADSLGYPVLVRPSYVLGGQGMEIAYDEQAVREYMRIINLTEQEHPILIDKYLMGREVEVDAVCDGENVLIPGIMEHVERAGIHSGDSISVYPPQNISDSMRDRIVKCTGLLAQKLNVKGLVNIQYILYRNALYVIEVNPRSSRTVPYISKITGLPVVELGVRASLGEKLTDMGYGTGLYGTPDMVCVKVPVFSFEKLSGVEVSLGPEMKSTGEVLAVAKTFSSAMKKGFKAAGMLPEAGGVLITVAKHDRDAAVPIARGLEEKGFTLYATPGTAKHLAKNGMLTIALPKLSQAPGLLTQKLREGAIKLIIDTPTRGREPLRDGFMMRRTAVECGVPCFTSLDTAKALIDSIDSDIGEPIGLHDISINK
ncbi:MAG: carbamoyl-phosphate synthase large subunit [Christensenellales bacterium]